MRRGQASSSKSVSTKKLTISDYRRRLKDNVRSLSENLTRMVQAAKIPTDDTTLKTNSIALMADKLTLCNELCSRTALMTRAADELLKLTSDIREFLIFRDFNFTNYTIEKAEDMMRGEIGKMDKVYDDARLDLVVSSIEIDRQLADNFGLKN